jgi:hypothetical protein
MAIEAEFGHKVKEVNLGNNEVKVVPITIGDVVNNGTPGFYLVVDQDGNLGQVELDIHSHDNKTVLDGITAQKVADWNSAVGWGDHAQGGYADANAVSLALGDKVPNTRQLTINGTTYDLSQNRTWNISTGASPAGVVGQAQMKQDASTLGAMPIYFDSDSGDMGYNEPNPSVDHHFQGKLRADGSVYFQLNSNNGSMVVGGDTVFRKLSNVLLWGQTGVDIQKFYSGGIEAVTINANQNVGLMDDTPDSRLDVNGGISQSQMDEPVDPVAGKSIEWTSNGNGMGNAGEVWKKSNQGGTITYAQQL